MLEQRYRWGVNREDGVETRDCARYSGMYLPIPRFRAEAQVDIAGTKGHICLSAPQQPPSRRPARKPFWPQQERCTALLFPGGFVVAEAELFEMMQGERILL